MVNITFHLEKNNLKDRNQIIKRGSNIMKIIKQKNKSVVLLLITITCFLSNISQIPYLVENGKTRILPLISWTILFLILIFKEKEIKIRKIKILLIPYMFFLILLFSQIFISNKFLSSLLVYPFSVSLFVYIVGTFSSKYFLKQDFNDLFEVFILSTLIVTVFVYKNYFMGTFEWLSRTYSYASKNSISQIILTAIIIAVIGYRPPNNIRKALNCVSTLFMTYVLLMLKSRASILGLFILGFVMLFYEKGNIKNKKIIITGLLLTTLLLLFNEKIHRILIEGVLFAGRKVSNLDDLSSGRLSMLLEFPKLFSKNFILGRGEYYTENFYLGALIQHGLIGGFLLITFSLFPIFWINKYSNRRDKVDITILTIALCYSFNAIFEARAPFGPGIKCYFLWFLFGVRYCMDKKVRRKVMANEDKSKHYCADL